MHLGAFTARFSHGLLVIAAPESVDPHEDWDAAAVSIHAGPDSVYVGVRETASGLVMVSCVEASEVTTDLVHAFSGHLSLPSARLRFCDPDETICMTVPVSEEEVEINIYTNGGDEPSELLVQIRSY
ncbi:hypothetical protein GCM10027176_13840 [Actinoallomurus bryophytorum]